MKLYKMIIHPYRIENNTKKPIEEFRNKWFDEEDKQRVCKKIYELYKVDGESLLKFSRRFQLHWQEMYVEVNLSTNMDNKIEKLDYLNQLNKNSGGKKSLEQVKNECKYGDVFTIKEFAELHESGCILPCDGFGHLHDGEQELKDTDPFEPPVDTWEELLEKYPYVCWYNK